MLRSVDWQVVGNVSMEGGVFETFTRRNITEASNIHQHWGRTPNLAY